MENNISESCTHDCSTCSSSCSESSEPKPSVFDRFNSVVEDFMTDEGFERLNRIIAGLEADDTVSEEKK